MNKIAWKKVDPILICKSCGISVKTDDSEDDII